MQTIFSTNGAEIQCLEKKDTYIDFADYKKIWKRLLLTNGIEHAEPASKTPTVEALLFMDYLNEG